MLCVALLSTKSSGRALWRCRSGAAASEMSLILPLLTTMIFAILEYGTVIYCYSAMQFGANRVARTVSVNRMTNAEAEAAALELLPAWVRNHVSISVTQSAPIDPNTNLVRVQLSAAAEDATPIAILTRVVPWQLNANVAMKQELPYVD
jgi:Flp pilus assembly protein TadG